MRMYSRLFFDVFAKTQAEKTQAPKKLKLFYFKTQAFCIKTQCTGGFFAKFSVNTIAVFWKIGKNSKMVKFFGQNSHFFL